MLIFKVTLYLKTSQEWVEIKLYPEVTLASYDNDTNLRYKNYSNWNIILNSILKQQKWNTILTSYNIFEIRIGIDISANSIDSKCYPWNISLCT